MKKRSWLIFSFGFLSVSAVGVLGLGHAFANAPESDFVSLVDFNRELNYEGVESFDELIALLRTDAVDFLGSEISWTSSDGDLSLMPAEMGIYVDFDEVEAELESFMTTTPEWKRAWIYFNGKSVDLPLVFDDAKLQAAFENSGLEYDAENASYGMLDGNFTVLPHSEGYAIDWGTLKGELVEAWNTEWVGQMELPRTVLEPAVLSTDLESHVEQAAELASQSLILQDEYGTEWGLELMDHVDWFEPIGEELTLNQAAFEAFAGAEWGEAVKEEVQPATITVNENGNYDFEGSARFGKTLDEAALYSMVINELSKEERESILFPVLVEEPEVTVPDELAAMGVTELLGYGYSNFSGSPSNRIYNINVGFNQYNGTLVEAGDEFSFTALLGPVDAAHGWKPELVIKGDDTIPEYGGGLCQVSSTMFRAALYSGFPITMRLNHSYAVSYYAHPFGYGLDATIYDPLPDFRFENDSGAPILIQGYTEGSNAYFVFYGSYDGRRVKMEGPVSYGYHSISEPDIEYTSELAPGVRVLDSYAHTGFQTDWWRTIYYADGSQSERENFHSDYEARPAKYLEGKTEESSDDSSEVSV